MAHTFLLFDFGTDEEAAQKARHRLDAWKQAFRPGNKVLFKFERQPSAATQNLSAADSASKTKRSEPEKKREKNAESGERICLLIRLDFSAHEKNLYQTWLERIPAEEPFKSANPESIDRNADKFEEMSELFRNLT
ncbi:MAG TPA: hypothetical protein VKS20_01730 [Candidatus Acidoferrales bacterium]|nr:hypothetical protein [Candidatus Acidoferrales bacterium]